VLSRLPTRQCRFIQLLALSPAGTLEILVLRHQLTVLRRRWR
jgi:hypothetical protein